jgi:DNA-binding NarL/FixJ family response regulator
MSAFRILLADGQPIFRLGLRAVLSSHDGWEICGEATEARDAAEKCRQLKPDLIILDICMPASNGVEGFRQILKDNPAQKILILSDADSEKVVRDCLRAGVRGWMLRSDGADDLTRAVEAVQQEKSVLGVPTPAVLVRGRWRGNPGPAAATAPQLTPREREVLQLLAEGRRAKDVAGILNIAAKTAETHRSNLMSKLNLHSMAKLVVYAVRNQMIRVQRPDGDALAQGENHLTDISVQNVA